MTAARRRDRRRYAAAAVLFATTGCAGPTTPINAALKEYPQNVRLGDAVQSAKPVVPIPPAAPPTQPGGYAPLPTGPRPPEQVAPSLPPAPSPSADPCPAAPPGAPVGVPAGPRIAGPPAAAVYSYRTDGRHTVGGANARTVDHPLTSTREVSAARITAAGIATPGHYEYDVTVTLGTHRAVTTYRVVDSDVLPEQPGGLYVTRVATLGADGKVASEFLPQPPMLVLPLPADEGATFSVVSTDARTGTTVTYSGKVGPHVTVDACGTLVDSRSVVHEGTISIGGCGSAPCPSGDVGATTATTFTAEYDVATQYGGLAVRDRVQVQGGGLDAPFTDELRGTINSAPLEPAS